MSARQDQPIVAFGSAKDWAAWLAKQHARSSGVWLKIARKASGIDTVSYPQALDVALCYGWIDGQKDKLDGDHWLQRFTPRTPRSKWSKVNCAKATELIKTGRMKPSGLREVERAKADGRWDAAYDAQSTAAVPDDLQRELDRNLAGSSQRSTAETGTRSCTGSRKRRSPTPGCDVLRTSPRC